MDQQVFIGLVIDWENDFYKIHIINPTEKHYKRVQIYSGAFCGDEDGLVHTSTVTKELGELKPHSAIALEEGDAGAFDFVVWFWIDLYATNQAVEKMHFQIPKYARDYDKKKEKLPLIDQIGQKILLDFRTGSEGKTALSIDEKIAHKEKTGEH